MSYLVLCAVWAVLSVQQNKGWLWAGGGGVTGWYAECNHSQEGTLTMWILVILEHWFLGMALFYYWMNIGGLLNVPNTSECNFEEPILISKPGRSLGCSTKTSFTREVYPAINHRGLSAVTTSSSQLCPGQGCVLSPPSASGRCLQAGLCVVPTFCLRQVSTSKAVCFPHLLPRAGVYKQGCVLSPPSA